MNFTFDISTVIHILGMIVVAWIAYKQAKLTKNMQSLEENTNSIKDALVKSTADASRLIGNAEGQAELKVEQKTKRMKKLAKN